MTRRLIALAAFLTLFASCANAEIRITRDFGGRIGDYVDRYSWIRNSSENVVIDGPCLSACTIVLSAIPKERICVTNRASLGFHAAWDYGPGGTQLPAPEATQMLYAMYPSGIKRWINGRGGLRKRMVFLKGKQLAGMYPHCSPQGQQTIYAGFGAPQQTWSPSWAQQN